MDKKKIQTLFAKHGGHIEGPRANLMCCSEFWAFIEELLEEHKKECDEKKTLATTGV